MPAAEPEPASTGPRPAPLHPDRARGFGYGLLAYGLWGLMPVYFRSLAEVPPSELLAHRVVWAFLFLLPIGLRQDRLAAFGAVFRAPRSLALLAGTTAFIAANWLIYIWAVLHDRVVEASLGYFMTPLVNVLLGVLVLKERLPRAVRAALLLAALGVLWLTLMTGRPPWVSLGLAVSFGSYGLLRKLAPVGAVPGLTVETALLFPLCLAYFGSASSSESLAFLAGPPWRDALLLAAGPITAVPLLLFAGAVRRLPLTSLGFLQYLSPTIQFLLATLVYREPFGWSRALAFSLIWAGLVVFALHTLRVARAYRRT
jgi:chloramphenicol-sensitive protein RarD